MQIQITTAHVFRDGKTKTTYGKATEHCIIMWGSDKCSSPSNTNILFLFFDIIFFQSKTTITRLFFLFHSPTLQLSQFISTSSAARYPSSPPSMISSSATPLRLLLGTLRCRRLPLVVDLHIHPLTFCSCFLQCLLLPSL